MAKIIARKMYMLYIAIILVILGAGFLLWQLFGGKVKKLKEEEFIFAPKERKEEAKKFPVAEMREEKVAIVYNKNISQGVREVIAKTGNLDFVRKGDKVLVKPNVNTADPSPGTTHPEVVREIVKMLKEKGAYVIVADRSTVKQDTMEAMKKTGIYDAAEEAGADEILNFSDLPWVRVQPEKSRYWPRGFRVTSVLQRVDHVISIPVLHTHGIASHSLAIKNLVGVIHPLDRYYFHASPKMNEMITEIALAVKPSLTVIDGYNAFIAGGPGTGELRTPYVYLASKDLVAAEILGVNLLIKIGSKLKYPDAYSHPGVARALDLNLSSLSQEEIKEETRRHNL